MKCAKCGHEVDPSSPNCPYCASGASRETWGKFKNAVVENCPCCGSDRVEQIPVWWWRKTDTRNPLLKAFRMAARMGLALLKINPYGNVCLDCNHRWKQNPRKGWQLMLLAATVILLAVCALPVGGILLLHLLTR